MIQDLDNSNFPLFLAVIDNTELNQRDLMDEAIRLINANSYDVKHLPPKPKRSKRIGTTIRTKIFILSSPKECRQKQRTFACVQTTCLACIELDLILLEQVLAVPQSS